MATLFISLVGTQVMGTLQPLLALAQNEALDGDGALLSVRLLATPEVRSVADRLLEYVQKHNLGEGLVLDIPEGLQEQGENSCVDTVTALAKVASDAGQHVVFNLDGGQNYMISACVLALAPFSPHLVQVSDSRVVLSDGSTACTLPMPAPLVPADLLALQGVAYTKQSLEGWSIPTFCQRGNLPLPQNALCGVCIDDITFDMVWNPGNNRLHFLLHAFHQSSDNDKRKAMERNLAHWASDRVRSSQLYDRKVTVFVQDDKTMERFLNESTGKLNVCNVAGWGSNSQLLREPLRKLFERTIPAPGNLPTPKKPARGVLPDNTLVVYLGTNVAPTLLAIITHKPAHVVLCYTPNEKTAATAQRLLDMAPELGISLSLVPVSIEGLHLDHLLPAPEAGTRVHGNITPGSKGQGAMLALWAKRHNAAVWSIYNQNSTAAPLFAPHGETALPLTMGDPALLFRLMGQKLHTSGTYIHAAHPDFPFMDSLLAFMRAALREGKDAEVFCKTTQAGGMELTCRSKIHWELYANGQRYSFSFKGGEWFEKLAAVAFFRAGAQHVRQRVRSDWSEATRNAIQNKHQNVDPENIFRSDLDVVGAWGADVFLVSCKSNREDKIDAPAVEALHTGTSLGRFTLRFLAHMGCTKAFQDPCGTMVLGWRELCQPECLTAIFETQRRAQSTTHNKSSAFL